MSKIRDATPDDFDAVQALYRQLLEYEATKLGHDVNPAFAESDYGVQCLKGFVTDKVSTMAIICEDDAGRVVGYACLRDIPPLEVAHRNNIKQCEIETISVDAGHRDRGVGRTLIEECKSIAIKNGYTHLKIVTLTANDRAKKLYETCGFEEQYVVYEMEL